MMLEWEERLDWGADRIAIFALFDSEYYHRTYPDVRQAGVDSFEHFLSTGWREMRNPSARFNTAEYLALHPDVAAAGINPLLHYAIAGAVEGRCTKPPARKARKQVVMNAQSPRTRAQYWQPVPDAASPLSLDRLTKILDSRLREAVGVAMALSHDQYRFSSGGVQNCILDEERALIDAGWAYLHLCPARPVPMLANSDGSSIFAMVLTINGKREGVVRLPDLLEALDNRPPEEPRPVLIVHHMLGFSVNAVRLLAQACTGNRAIFWVHDFFTLCPNPFLLRNDVTFCNAPPSDSGGCLVCCYGAERQRHQAELVRLFEDLQPFILSPSQAALDFWTGRGSLAHAGSQVTPHAVLTLDESAPRGARKTKAPLRVAHLGAALAHKGWPTFEALVERHGDDPRYQFFRLGLGEAGLRGLTEAPVEVTATNRNAMVDALRDHEIDVVINWSKCFETFSFTALEAVAGGAYVLAREGAGNVWPAIAGTGRGRAVRTETELRALFLTGDVQKLARGAKPRGELQLARGATDFVLNGGCRD